MTNWEISSAMRYSTNEVARVLTRGFEGYFVPVHVDDEHLQAMLREDSVDLAESRLIHGDGEEAGVALIARRGWTSRLAAMGIVRKWRGRGAGGHLMRRLLEDARSRGDHEMVLEVITDNEPAIHLYEEAGFSKVRRLVSLRAMDSAKGSKTAGLDEIDVRELARQISIHGLPDLPWQLSGETMAQFAPPFRAYALAGAYAMISDPAENRVGFRALVVERAERGKARASEIIQAIMACHPGKEWKVPALFPEEMVGPFERAGFTRESLAQWQMSVRIS